MFWQKNNVFYDYKCDSSYRRKLTEEQCRDCWCAKYCYICTAHLDQGDGLSRELKQKHCAGVRKSIENDFKDYCLLHEMSGLDDDVIYLN